MMLERIDTWIGKTLFVPLIIRLCQHSGWTQWQVNRYGWFAASLVGLYFADSWLMKAIFGFGALLWCLMAALFPPHYPDRSQRWLRLLFLFGMAVKTPGWVMAGPNWTLAVDLLALIAEYALTIRTIPPLESRQAKRTYSPAAGKA